MKTVILILQGGLGNQLFQIASAVAWRRDHGIRVLIDHRTGFLADKFERSFIVDRVLDIPSLGLVHRPWAALPFRYAAKIARRLGAGPAKPLPVYTDSHIGHLEAWLRSPGRGFCVLDGYWQNIARAASIRAPILASIRAAWLDAGASGHDLRLPPGRSHLVGVHLRLKYSYSAGNRFVCPLPTVHLDYYRSAVRAIKEALPAPHFVVCADSPVPDAQLASLGIDSATNLTGHGRTEAEDFEALRQCPSLVLSQSSFAWSAALLRTTPPGMVVCPDLRQLGQKMYPLPGWITLPAAENVAPSTTGLLR